MSAPNVDTLNASTAHADVQTSLLMRTKGDMNRSGVVSRSGNNDAVAYDAMMQLTISFNPLRYETFRSFIIWFITSCILFLTNQLTTLPVGFFPIYAQQTLHMTPVQLTLFFTIYPLCIMVSSPLAAALSPVSGRQTLICVGMVVSGMSTIAFAYASSIESVYLLRMGQGLGAGAAVVGAFSMITEEFSATIGHVLVIQECIVAAAFVTAPPLGSLLFEYYGFHMPFLVSGMAQLFVVMIVPLLFIEYALPDTTYSRAPRLTSLYTINYRTNINHVGFRDVLTPSCTICLVVTVFAMGSFGFIDPYLGSHLQTVLGMQHTAIGLGFGVSALVYFIGGIVYVRLSRSYGCKQVILFGLFQLSIGFFFLGPAPFLNEHFSDYNRLWSTQWFALICIGCGAALAIAPGLPLTLMSVAQSGTQAFNLIIGLFSAAIYLGQAAGPFLALGTLQILPVTHTLNCFVTTENECMSSLPWAFTMYSFLVLGLFGIVAFRLKSSEVNNELLELKRRVSLNRQASEYGQFVFFEDEENDDEWLSGGKYMATTCS